MIWARGRMTTWLATGLLLVGCAHGRPAAGPPDPPASSLASPSPSPSPSATVAPGSASASAPVSPHTKPGHREVASAVRTLRRYLRVWVSEGRSSAGRFLVPGQRVASDLRAPRISAGTVTSYRLYRWGGPRSFPLLVSLDLTFTNDPVAWSRGRNERFVTARRAGRDGGYLLELATSP